MYNIFPDTRFSLWNRSSLYGIDLIYGIEHDDNTAVIPEGTKSDAIYSLTIS